MSQLAVLPSRSRATDHFPIAAPPSRCQDCAIRDASLCASLKEDELAVLHDAGRRRTIPAGQVISWAGDPSAICANVVRGVLKITASIADGREQIVGLLFPGDFVGQLFEDEVTLSIVALTEVDICCYSRKAFEDLLDEFPRMERMLLKQTMATLNDARDRLLALGRKTAQEKVAGFVLSVARKGGERDDRGNLKASLPLSRGEIADFLGLTIETVSRQLTRLKAENILAFEKGERDCTILDLWQLETIVNPI